MCSQGCASYPQCTDVERDYGAKKNKKFWVLGSDLSISSTSSTIKVPASPEQVGFFPTSRLEGE
jgi:hypothetical protein